MSITTLASLTSQISAQFTFLVEIYPSQHIQEWTEQEDTVFYNAIGTGLDVQSVYVDGSAYTEADNLTDLLATATQWFYDGSKLYVHVTGDAGTTLNTNTVVANYKVYYSNDAKTFNDVFYNPALQSVPNIRQTKQDLFWGVSIISSGKITLANDGAFDTIYNSWAWENKRLNILFGGEDLPYTEYVSVFDGIITSKDFNMQTFSLAFQDKKEQLTSSIEYDTFSTGDFSDLNAEDVGKPVPHVWGVVKKMPAICINRDESPAPVNYEFKIADTTNHDIGNVTAAYVNDISKSVVSVDTGEGTFTIAATDYTAGDPVTADVTGFQSGGENIENPIDILEELLELAGYTDSDWDTTARATAKDKASQFPCGLVMNEYTGIIDSIGDLMKSCFGTFYINNDGEFTVKVFTPIAEPDLDTVDDLDIVNGSFSAKAMTSKIRKVFRCGYARNWAADSSYAYKQTTATDTERIYDITKSRTVPTLLSNDNGAQIWLDRMKLLYETGITEIKFQSSLQFASKNIGDQMVVSFRRRREDSDITWLSERRVDLLSIFKNFQSKTMSFLVDDLKGIGDGVGHWTDPTLTFPDILGGGTFTAWDADWTEGQKDYAFQTWGFWTDEDGLIDADDSVTLNKSRWW